MAKPPFTKPPFVNSRWPQAHGAAERAERDAIGARVGLQASAARGGQELRRVCPARLL